MRFTKKNDGSRVTGLSLCLFVGLSLCLWRTTVALDSAGPPPSIRIGDTCTTIDSRLSVPILIANEEWDTRVQITIDYDEVVLNYGWHPQGSPWEVEGPEQKEEGRTTIVLRRVPGRSALPRPPGVETTAIQLFFTLRQPSPDQKLPFLAQTQLSLDPAGSFFFIGGTLYPRDTRVHSGTATIYYRDGVEVGSGSITRRKQDFILPVYLTYLAQTSDGEDADGEDADGEGADGEGADDENADDDAPPERAFTIGVDYDEVFLRMHRITGVDGAAASFDPAAPGEFSLKIPAAPEETACRRHVANLHFRYTGERADPETPDIPVDEIPVSAALISGAGFNAIVQGDGVGAGSPPGSVKFMDDYFVRGNTDSRTAGPQIQLTDAVRILIGFFHGKPIPCADAADVNNNGSIDITDAIHIVNFLYRSGPPPAPPFPAPGLDDPGLPPMDDLGCGKPLPMFRLE